MKYICIIFSFLGLLLLSGCNDSLTPDPSHTKEEIQTLVDSYQQQFQHEMLSHPIGIGLFISTEEEDIYVSSGLPSEYGESIHFRAASNSKTFTAAAILKLHQEGRLDINDTITSYIPETREPYAPESPSFDVPNKSSITIKQLLQHRAGVFDVTNNIIPSDVDAPYAGQYFVDYIKSLSGDEHTFSFEELVGVVAEHQLSDFMPGEQFKYSNTGYNLLGVIIERVSGIPLHTYLETIFFKPLGLNDSYSPHLGTDNQLPEPHVRSYVKIDEEIIEIDTDNLTSAISEGQIISTPKDLALWAKKLYGTHEVLDQETLALMTDAIPADEQHGYYGLGTQAFPVDLGFGHDGARVAFLSSMRYDPDTKTSFVVFTNYINVDDMMTEGEALYEILRQVKEVLTN